MAQFFKVIFREGMFLAPHHIQQWDRYHQGSFNFSMRSLIPWKTWGLTELEIDREGLANDNFTLLRCRGIFPEGCMVDIPNLDDPPLPRRVQEHFQPSMQSLDVYLAIPIERSGSPNCLLSGEKPSRETRYIEDFVSVFDYNTGRNELNISIAKKNIKVLFHDEISDEYELLKIAKLVHTSTGAIGLEENYIPPALNISCSRTLIGIIRGLLSVLSTKSRELSSMCRQRTRDVYEFGPTDLSILVPLQIINSFIPLLNHFYRLSSAHPEEVFCVLSQLAGELSAFAVNINPDDLPEYRHDDLAYSFSRLDEVIRALLMMVSAPPARYRVIPLEKVGEFSFQGRVDDASLLSPPYRFFMGVKAEVSQEKIMDEIPRKAKVGSIETIELLTHSALPGVTLYYSALPPAVIPKKSGYLYFSLDNRGPYWESIRRSSSIAVYIPPEFVQAEVEMMAVEE